MSNLVLLVWKVGKPGALDKRQPKLEHLEERRLLAIDLSLQPHQVIDNQDVAYVETGSGWQSWTDTAAYNGDVRYHAAGDGSDVATWAFGGLYATKIYQLFATWDASSNHASNAPYAVSDGANPLGTIHLNQQFAPDQAVLNGVNWQSMGVYQTQTGSLDVSVSDNANGYVVADAICAVEVSAPTTAPSVVDNADPAYAETGGGWLGWSDPSLYQGDCRYAPAGTGQNTATWTFDGLDANTYQVYATWNPSSNHATNAPYTVFDNTTALATVHLDQQVAPSDYAISDWAWQSVGTYQVASGRLVVQLSDNANGDVVADAIRVVEVTPPTTPPSVVDNADAAYAETGGGWLSWSDPSLRFPDFRLSVLAAWGGRFS